MLSEDRLILLLKRIPYEDALRMFDDHFRKDYDAMKVWPAEQEAEAQRSYSSFLLNIGWTKEEFVTAIYEAHQRSKQNV